MRILLFALFALVAPAGTAEISEQPVWCSRLITRQLYDPHTAQAKLDKLQIAVPWETGGYKDASRFTLGHPLYGIHLHGLENTSLASDPRSPIVLFVYGNGMNVEGVLHSPYMELLEHPDRSYVLFDVPGYGLSKGEMSERGMVTAATAVIDMISATNPARPIMVWGRSMGAGIAIQACAQRPRVKRLLLMNGWSSIFDVSRGGLPGWVPDLFVRYITKGNRYDSVAAAREIKDTSVLMLHGSHDELFPVGMGAKVFDNLATKDKRMEVFPIGHSPKVIDDRMRSVIEQFLSGP